MLQFAAYNKCDRGSICEGKTAIWNQIVTYYDPRDDEWDAQEMCSSNHPRAPIPFPTFSKSQGCEITWTWGNYGEPMPN